MDTTARWRIIDPLQFLRSVRDERGGRTRLDDIIDSVVRDIISGTELEEIVRSGDWDVNMEELDEVEQDRDDVALDKQPKLGRENWRRKFSKAPPNAHPVWALNSRTCGSSASTISTPCAIRLRIA